MNHPTLGNTAFKAKADGRFTYADYKNWPEGERWELIDGVAYTMSPAPRRMHQGLLGQLSSLMEIFFTGKPCRPYMAPTDVFLSLEDEVLDDIETVVQPDLLVVCDRTKLTDEGIKGAPDFVLEILSTSYKDQMEKRDLYERHGVREFWTVNPATLEVFI